MKDRVILSPLKQGSRTPEEFRRAVRAVISQHEDLTPPEAEAKVQVMEKRTILAPVMRSPRRAVIKAAVKKVVASAANAEKTGPNVKPSRGKVGNRKTARGHKATPVKNK